MNRYIKALLVAPLLLFLVGAASEKTETGQTAEKIKDTVKNPVSDTVEIVQDEEKLKQAIRNQVKEKANNISVPRESGQIINARAACTQLVDKAKDYSSSGIGIPKGANNSTQKNNTSSK